MKLVLWIAVENASGNDLDGVVNLSEMIPVNNYHAMGSFYRYKGGLTTPGCDEVVQWTVFKDPLYISEDQVSNFKLKL